MTAPAYAAADLTAELRGVQHLGPEQVGVPPSLPVVSENHTGEEEVVTAKRQFSSESGPVVSGLASLEEENLTGTVAGATPAPMLWRSSLDEPAEAPPVSHPRGSLATEFFREALNHVVEPVLQTTAQAFAEWLRAEQEGRFEEARTKHLADFQKEIECAFASQRKRLEEATEVASARMEQANQKIEDLERHSHEIVRRSVEEIEQRSSQLLAEALALLEKALNEAIPNTFRSVMFQAAEELDQKGKDSVRQFQGAIEDALKQSLQRAGKELGQMFQQIGGRMLTQTEADGVGERPPQVSSVPPHE